MDTQAIIEKIKNIKDKISPRDLKIYNFDLTERIILRLDSFAECSKCRDLEDEFASILEEIKNDSQARINKKYLLHVKMALDHLQKEHKLVAPGYYTNLYMVYGISIGLPFGIIFWQLLGQMALIGIGLPIGIAMGLSIGSKLDNEAKGKGLVI